MPLWILCTLIAAAMQALRTAHQKQLAEKSSATAATLARYLFALPFAWLYLLALLPTRQEPLQFSAAFWGYSVAASVTQIIATVLMVRLFAQRNYAIGITFAKTETLLIALLGFLIFSDPLALSGWVGVMIGAAGVLLLSPARGINFRQGNGMATTALGLCSGLGFALTSLWVRQAGLSLGDQWILNAAVTLASMISLQTMMLLIYMLLRSPGPLRLLFRHRGLSLRVGISSVIGSAGWFTAMTLENAALVKTVGQIEFFFMLLLSARWFKEQHSPREYAGFAATALSVIFILWNS